MFKITWRPKGTVKLITGLSRFPTYEAAGNQVMIWKSFFPTNTYYIEPVNVAAEGNN